MSQSFPFFQAPKKFKKIRVKTWEQNLTSSGLMKNESIEMMAKMAEGK